MGNMNVMDINGQLKYTRKHLKYNFIESCLLGYYTTTSSNVVFGEDKMLIKEYILMKN